MLNIAFKESVHQFCLDFVDHKIENLHKAIQDTMESIHHETKSSAGDKHETSRAMTQIESERLAGQLTQWQKTKEALLQVPKQTSTKLVELGSLIPTNAGYFYISVGLGKLTIQDKKVFAVPTHSPIGKLMLHKKIGDSFVFDGKECIIEDII